VSLRGTGHEHGSYRMVNYDFINLSLCKEVDGVPKPDVYISFESSLSAFCFSKILSESEEIENLLSESEAKRHGNFPSESEANLPFEIFAFSLFSLFRFYRKKAIIMQNIVRTQKLEGCLILILIC
jgi:hypothetical protein